MPGDRGSTAVERQCFSCNAELSEPFVSCCECLNLATCLSCFSAGREGGGHESNHRYKIIRNDFLLFDQDWKASDELSLLDKLTEFGPSHWTEIAKHLNKMAAECERHYSANYLDVSADSPLPRPASPDQLYRPLPLTFKSGIHDPPRPLPNTSYARDWAGYCAARGDFQTEIYQNAELDVASISQIRTDDWGDDEDWRLCDSLDTCIVEIYNEKLRQRARKKRIICEHGLINIHRHLANRLRYDSTLSNRLCERLSPFAQLLRFDDFTALFEGLHCQAELRQKILTLHKYRMLGLRTFRAAHVYTQLQMQRDRNFKSLKQYAANLSSSMPIPLAIVQASCSPAAPAGPVVMLPLVPVRRSAPPLDIVGLPGYDKLNDGERQLCSMSRLVPESYLEFKNLLIVECRSRKGIRLAQARSLIKIDVNKTRKIFDFLLDEKLIYLPSN